MPNSRLQKKSNTNRYQQSWKDQNQNQEKRGNSSKNKKSSKKRGGIKKLFLNKYFFLFILFIILGVSAFGITVIVWASKDLPNPDQLMERNVAQTTKIYDRSGENLLYQIHGDQQRTLMSLDDIPEHVRQATIAIEDKNFYEHEGFSIWAIIRTALTNIIYDKKAGASTLTQQLIKNTVLTPEKTYTRKIKELILAYRMENIYTKDEILQMYLNEVPYGGVTYGVEAASQHYFDKSVTEINVAESAILASLPQSPSLYSPYGPHKERLMGRQQYIINLMREQGYITEEEAEQAKNTKIAFKEPSENIKAPHFVMYVKKILAEKYGQRTLEQEGLKIYTTLDWFKQSRAEKIIKEAAEKNLANYNAENAALVSMDPKTGQILVMVGSKDYFSNDLDGQFNVATADRQPGSSLKPMAYATAFEKGYKPATILHDTKTDFAPGEDDYIPQNFDGNFRGPISMRKALAGSLNIPAVKTLYLAGKEEMFKNLEDLGYTTLQEEDRYGLSLVLGGGEVKLLEHTNAYSAFAREGEIRPASAILKVENSEGEVIEEFKNKTRETWDPDTARMISDVLSDNSAREYAYGQNNQLTLGDRPVAAKTGTTNDFKDAWTIGYTPSLVTGVWVGNNDNASMAGGSYGGTVAAPIWNQYMQTILGDTPIEEFKEPNIKKTGKSIIDGDIEFTKTVEIDKASGLLATEHTPEDYREEATFENHHSILHYVDKDNPLEDKPENPEEDPQYDSWEKGVREWAKKENKGSTSTKPMDEIPEEEDNVHKPENEPTFEIQNLTNNQIVDHSILKTGITKASAPRGVSKAEYYINDELLYTSETYPFNFEQNISYLKNGYHDLKVRVCDDVDNCSSNTMTFNLVLDEDQREKDKMDISWISPQKGLAVNSIDFPLNLKIQAQNHQKLDKLEIILSPQTGTSTKLYTINDISSPIITKEWTTPPPSGVYHLYARGEWRGFVKETEKIIISVTSPE
ncbi:MAG: penicillin-binding protein [Patescibacteria group bacterium]